MATQVRFKTKLAGNGTSMSYIEIPKRILESFDGRKRVKVRASLNGFTYRTTICTMGGVCAIPVRREIRVGAGLMAGDRVGVVLEEDLEPRIVSIPSDLLRELKTSRKLHDRFLALSYTHQKEYVTWVTEARKPETRSRRIAKILEKLASGD